MKISYPILAAAFLSACSPKAPEPPVVEPAVIITSVEKKDLVPEKRFVGRVIADEIIHVRTRVEGRLLSQDFIEGRRVKKGQRLFLIEQDLYKSDVLQAEGEMKSKKASASLAEKAFDRVERLFNQKAVSKLEYDQALSDRNQTLAALQKSQAQLTKAALALQWTEILSPIDGRTGVVSVNKGNYITPGSDALVTLTKDDQMKVEFTISEKDLIRSLLKKESRQAKKGDELKFIKVQLFLPDGTPYKHLGRIAFWDNRINPTTGSLKVRALFPNEESLLSDGMYVKIRTFSQRKEEALLIPQAAVLEDQSGQYVFVVTRDAMTEKRKITTGMSVLDKVKVISGLMENENIILQGLQKVGPGMKVKASTFVQEKE